VTSASGTVDRITLERRSNRLARVYQRRGVIPGSLVAIALPNGIELFAACLAVWKLGATPLMLSPWLPAAERDRLLGLAQPSLLVGVAAEQGVDVAAVPAGFEPDTAVSDAPLPLVTAPAWKAMASGGSTGAPKLIVADLPANGDTLGAVARKYCIERGDVQLITAPMYHNGPFQSGMIGLLSGNHVVVVERFDPLQALEAMERHRITWVYLVPTMMSRIWRLPAEQRDGYDLSSVRIVFHLAAPCPRWLKEAWIGWLGPERIWELYGATDGQAATVIGGTEWLEHRGSVGKPIAGGRVKILGSDGEELPAGAIGEVFMGRPEGTPEPYHYLGAPAVSRDGWQSYGDMGRLDEDGYLYLADRRTDMILVGGVNVYPAEIEAALEEHPAVQSSCVIGLPDEDLGSRIHAIVQVEGAVAEEALREHVAARLERRKAPHSFELVDFPLRDETGKTPRYALRQERIQGTPVENS
jgi:bile acid-coenzyme A ligase